MQMLLSVTKLLFEEELLQLVSIGPPARGVKSRYCDFSLQVIDVRLNDVFRLWA